MSRRNGFCGVTRSNGDITPLHSIIVAGKNGGIGIGLVEIYDLQ
jgi:hypothetical protein